MDKLIEEKKQEITVSSGSLPSNLFSHILGGGGVCEEEIKTH